MGQDHHRADRPGLVLRQAQDEALMVVNEAPIAAKESLAAVKEALMLSLSKYGGRAASTVLEQQEANGRP